MGKKQLWIVIAGLIMVNCLTVAFFLTNQKARPEGTEVVATIGDDVITRQDWLNAMERRYGKELLKEMIDQRVIETLADEYGITVSNAEIERQLLLVKTLYSSSNDPENEEEWREQIKANLFFEELLTKDVQISEEEIQTYFEQNRSHFSIPTSYHISHIVVQTLEEALQTIKELKEGSNFATLAKERSIDTFSASQGGDIGYIQDNEAASVYLPAVKSLKVGEWSSPIAIDDESFAIVLLHEVLEGKEYPIEEVKNEIRRLIALEQMEGHQAVEVFWNEANVDWYYGENK